MAFLTSLRATLAGWFDSPRRTAPGPRLALQDLESREVPAVGGGFTGGGILGQYFDNANLSGQPAFSRRDVRIDFNWQGQSPGGSTSPDYRNVGPDYFSVRWSGQLIPRFSETYTFRTTSDDGVRLWIKATDSTNWTQLVDNWTPHAATDNTGTVALVAGKTYDVRMDYQELGGQAVARLLWSSPSTPEEVIDPAVNVGVNAVTYDYQVYTDVAKTGRAQWGDAVDYFGRGFVPTDSDGWPTHDAGHIFLEGQDPSKTLGVYLLRFQGKAEVTSWYNRGQFRVNGVTYGIKLPSGVGYDPATNETTAEVVMSQTDILGLNFRQTQRTAGSAKNTGITDVQLMRPLAPGSGSYYRPDDLFDSNVKAAFSRFTTLRYLTANFNGESNWADRVLPTDMKVAWGDRRASWENEVMLANETGKDLYITIPINASDDYVRKLALLLRYGSDGVNPYGGPVANPRYPGLNPNLHVYVEWANETWNWAFSQAGLGSVASTAAVKNNTANGKIINFDGLRPNGDFRRWTALRTVQASNAFRSVWGDASMGSQVRVLLEYQYDNQQDTGLEELRFIDNYFNNGDGKQHVGNPQPVSYYIWGAGGASYFGSSNPQGLLGDVFVPDGSFESAVVTAGQAKPRPGGTPWAFTGDAGVYHDAAKFGDNQRIAVNGVGAVPTTPTGNQALYVSGGGTATVTIDFPRAGVYAIEFRGASEFGSNMSDPLDFYFDDQRVTPHGADLTPNSGYWVPGTGYGRDSSKFVVYGTVPVYISGPGKHTFRIVGRGAANQTTLIDDLRVGSTDGIFASRLPGGGQAAGQVSVTDYRQQLAAQARYALAYGLKVVSYEGGWSLGGDTESVPIESYAKYRDGRTAGVMAQALDDFFAAGGELDVLGTYDQWLLDDAAKADSYPLVQGIDARMSHLAAPASVGIPIPGSLPVSTRAMDAIGGGNTAGYVRPGEWLSWNVVVSTTGDYQVATDTVQAGQVAVYVDGQPVVVGVSGGTLGETVRLTAGLHTLRVQSLGGNFYILNVSVNNMSAAQSAVVGKTTTTPGLPTGWRSDSVGAPALGGSATSSNGTWSVTGSGANIWGAKDEFQFAHRNVSGDVTLTAQLLSMDETHPWAKGGLMIRPDTDPSSPFAAVYRTPKNGILFEWRTGYRTAPVYVSVPAGTGPVWLRLTRHGNTFTAFFSHDGKTWTKIGGSMTISMPSAAQGGLVVTSHDVTKRATAKFNSVTVG